MAKFEEKISLENRKIEQLEQMLLAPEIKESTSKGKSYAARNQFLMKSSNSGLIQQDLIESEEEESDNNGSAQKRHKRKSSDVEFSHQEINEKFLEVFSSLKTLEKESAKKPPAKDEEAF